MNKAGKLWTDSVAYLALTIGAGLSIAGNVADTARTRGQDMDVLDVVMAVSWPALVILMVEIFVSRRWTGLEWPMQMLRWIGTLAIGGMAMRVSWVHLNDLMASRGQKADVAIFGPLAIDCLAIMATALILAGRRTLSTHVDKVVDKVVDNYVAKTLDTGGDRLANAVANLPATWTQPQDVPPLDIDRIGSQWTTSDTHWLDRLGAELDSSTTPAAPVTVGTLPQRKRTVRGQVDEAEALEFARIGRQNGVPAGEIAAFLAGHYEVSERTVRRIPGWRLAAA